MSRVPRTHRFQSSAIATDQVPSVIGVNVENHSRVSVTCSVAPAFHVFCSRFIEKTWECFVVTIMHKSWVHYQKSYH